MRVFKWVINGGRGGICIGALFAGRATGTKKKVRHESRSDLENGGEGGTGGTSLALMNTSLDAAPGGGGLYHLIILCPPSSAPPRRLPVKSSRVTNPCLPPPPTLIYLVFEFYTE